MAEARPRITYFDWLRGAATYAVVLLHMCNKILTDYPTEQLGTPLVLAWTELQLVLTRWSVPFFLMITGALLLDPKRSVGWDKVIRYVGRMACVLLVFCPIYSCMSARAITLPALIKGVGDALTHNSWDHLWYVYDLMGLYLLTPVLSLYTHAATREQQRSVLVALGILTLAMPTINAATGAGITTLGWVSSSVFYFLLGTYAHRFMHFDSRLAMTGWGALLLCTVACAGIICLGGGYPKWLIVPESPLIAAWSLLLFVSAHAFLDGRSVPRPLAFASSHSLAIYLIHPLLVIFIYRRLWWIPYETFPPVIFEVIVMAILYGITLPTAALIKRVPGLRNIL